MLTMDKIHTIREMYYEQCKSLRQISSELHLDWKTVKKYVDMEDFNEAPPAPRRKEECQSKLNPYKPFIDSWLTADLKAPRKQRHTASRVFNRLVEEQGYEGSYRLVATYVAAKKAELKLDKKQSYLPLIHHPGEAQADFGYADFIENGKLHQEAKYLVLSFPYSNGGYLQLNYGENLECLLEGLKTFFEYIGGVPTEIWFDNTRTIVTKVIKAGGRDITERFRRFSEHYRFRPVFMNPESGWEKGNVENKVGYLRRNELVPVPEFSDLQLKNADLLTSCNKDMEREHYEGRGLISELFKEDKEALLPLPSVPFDTAAYLTVHTDKYGKFTLDQGAHRYSTSSAFCDRDVALKITSSEVLVMDADMHEIVRHRRLYGAEEKESMQWVPYLSDIARKPRSLFNSGIFEMMPASMQAYMRACESPDRGRALKILAELTDRTGFDSAVKTVDEAIRFQAHDPDSLKSLYRRMFSDVPDLPPLTGGNALPEQKVIPFNTDLKALDSVLERREG